MDSLLSFTYLYEYAYHGVKYDENTKPKTQR